MYTLQRDGAFIVVVKIAGHAIIEVTCTYIIVELYNAWLMSVI